MGAKELADYLQASGVISSQRLYDAFVTIDRKYFMPAARRPLAYFDQALAIGHGQTISQPCTVAFMLEQLDVQPGHRVLDVGAGSGWTTALLGAMTGDSGRVFGVERIPELVKSAKQHLERYSLPWTSVEQAAPGVLGLPKYAPFDRILVSAAFSEIPETLLDQLDTPGKLVMPVNNSIVAITKNKDGLSENVFPGFVFVPLIP